MGEAKNRKEAIEDPGGYLVDKRGRGCTPRKRQGFRNVVRRKVEGFEEHSTQGWDQCLVGVMEDPGGHLSDKREIPASWVIA